MMCPRYCEIFGPGACPGVFQPERCRLKKFPVPDEHSEQVSLFRWWSLQYRDHPALLFAIPNGGARNAVTGARMKAEGVMAGVPDILLAASRQGFHGLWIELKRQKGGKVSEVQEGVIARLRRAGYRVEVCKGWTAAREAIENYLTGEIPKGASRRVEPAANQQPLADRRGRRAVQGR